MARSASVQVAGYYPIPTELLPAIAGLIAWEPTTNKWRRSSLLDPCAGDGEAIVTLRDLWNEAHPKRFYVEANELEGARARALEARVGHGGGQAYHADAFCLDWDRRSGAALSLLNPPYDFDPAFRRMELRWLTRFTGAISGKCGYLLFVIPAQAVDACAEFLARNYADLRAWRFPVAHFASFRQVVIFGRRLQTPLEAGTSTSERVRSWGAGPEALPELGHQREPMLLPLGDDECLGISVRPLDLRAVIEAHRAWEGAPNFDDVDLDRLLRAQVRTAMPPKPAHIAMGLAAGAFNGVALTPSASRPELPPILAKGVFGRQLVTVDETKDEKGEVVGLTQVEVPKLELAILRLDTYTYHRITPGTVPVGGSDPSRWTSADVVAGYDTSLAAALAETYPPIHDPRRLEQQIALPALPMAPFRAQAEVIQAAIKLLAQGVSPTVAGEVGSGKTLVALAIMAALHERFWAQTVAELRRVGIRGPLPKVRRTLVVLPPHLMRNWIDQAAAAVPWAKVVVIERLADLEEQADIYLLSREAAKLGSGIAGVEGSCPRCGTRLEESAGRNASRRSLCGAMMRRPENDLARLAEVLAAALVRVNDDRVVDLLPRALLRKRRTNGRLNVRLAGEVLDAILATQPVGESSAPWQVNAIATALGRATGRVEDVALAYERAETRSYRTEELRRDPTGRGPTQEALSALEHLSGLAKWRREPPCSERLYQWTNQPRRYPVARRISRKYRRMFSLVLIDESHEYNNGTSAQSKAAQRLMSLPGVPTIALTGSLTGGYASSLFTNWWAMSRPFREEFGRGERTLFVNRYGFRRVYQDLKSKKPIEFGAVSDRELSANHRILGEAPGVSPEWVMKHLLPSAVVIHKSDLDQELPPLSEVSVPVAEDGPHDHELLAEYKRIQDKVLERISADRFDKDRSGRLLGALLEVPSYLERATDEVGPFRLSYPGSCGGGLVVDAKVFPSNVLLPKERWLIEELKARVGAGEKVLLFLRHTGKVGLARRVMRLVAEHVTKKVAFLDAAKVPAAKREDWIRRSVLDAGVEVMACNPNSVRTGLNCLIAFSTAIWYQMDWSAICYRQANGRPHRIGQTRPVSIVIPYHADTAQALQLDLVARKCSASLQVDGLDMVAALEASGASEEASAAIAAAMNVGEQVFRILSGR